MRQGDKKAALELFEQLRRPLFGYLYRLTSDRNIAEDLLQETLLTIYARIETFNDDFQFMPWAYAIARNKFLEFKRKNSRVIRIHPEISAFNTEPSVSCFSSSKDLDIDLKSVLSQLSDPVREAFILKHFQNLTFVEVAGLQEIPVPTAKSRVLFAVKKIRDFLNRGEK